MQAKDHLKYLISFIYAARYGSFSAAAEALSLTPAAVSKNAALLEQSLGVRLFNRTTRSLSLTAEGRHFFEQSQKALTILQDAAEQISLNNPQEIAGSVRISMPNLVGRHLVFPHLAALYARYPKLHLELDFGNRVIDFIKAGFDCAIRTGEPQEGALVARRIAVLQSCLAASPDYLARYGIPNRPQELPCHRLLMQRLPKGKLQPWQFTEKAEDEIFDLPTPALILNDTETLAQAALQGFGIAQLPVYLALPYLQKGLLRTLLTESCHSLDVPLTLQYPHRTLLAPRVKAVTDYLLPRLQQDERLQTTQADLKRFGAGR